MDFTSNAARTNEDSLALGAHAPQGYGSVVFVSLTLFFHYSLRHSIRATLTASVQQMIPAKVSDFATMAMFES